MVKIFKINYKVNHLFSKICSYKERETYRSDSVVYNWPSKLPPKLLDEKPLSFSIRECSKPSERHRMAPSGLLEVQACSTASSLAALAGPDSRLNALRFLQPVACNKRCNLGKSESLLCHEVDIEGIIYKSRQCHVLAVRPPFMLDAKDRGLNFLDL
jgi:hypothetical protein